MKALNIISTEYVMHNVIDLGKQTVAPLQVRTPSFFQQLVEQLYNNNQAYKTVPSAERN